MEEGNQDIASLIDALDGFTESLTSVVQVSLDDIGRDLVQKTKSAGYTNRTNVLKDSIFYSVSNNKLTFGMKDYGYYQIFGVTGTERTGIQLGEVSRSFDGKGPGSKFEYDTSKFKHKGLKGYPGTAEYMKDVAQLLADQIIENIDF